MEKIILSLKNVYMTLMTEDFPIYSASVIGRAERKGHTMLRFWQGQMVPEFRCLPCGKMIWRNDGKRNRYTSYLCNRSAEIKTYSEYAGELASQIGVSSLINQINQFSEFLSHGKYRHDILLRRIQELVRLAKKDDTHLTGEIEEQIVRTAALKFRNAQEKLFQASYLLTLLMLYAAAGEAMDDASMSVLRQKEYRLEALWNIYTHPAQQVASSVTFLTVHSGIMQDNPLPQHRFFGREEEMLCHPLTLRLMARATRGRKWSVAELEKSLRENGLSVSWQDEEREIGMKQLYRQLYSYMQLSQEYHILAELFTILPRDSYSASFLFRYFPDITGSEAELRIKLSAMSEGGWLEADEDGWSIFLKPVDMILRAESDAPFVIRRNPPFPAAIHFREIFFPEPVHLTGCSY